MVPMLTCGLVRSNFALATGAPPDCCYLTRGCGVVLVPRIRARLLAADLLDDLVGDVRGNLGVRVELHRVRRLTGGLRPQVANVPEHLGQRHEGVDDHVAVTLLLRLDLAAARVDVADDRAQEALGRDHLDGEHRLEQHRLGPAGGLLEGLVAGDLERELGRVDVVVGAVLEGELHVDHGVAGEHAELHGVLTTLVDRRDVLLRDATTADVVDELVASAGAGLGVDVRTEVDDDLGELTRTAGLLLVGVGVLLDRVADRLAVGHLRLADGRLDAELALHAVDEDLQVELAHAGDDRLTGLFVGLDREGGVLVGEALDRGAELLLVTLGLRLDRDLDHRGRERHRLEDDLVLRVAQGVTGLGVLEAHDGHDLTGTDRRDLLTLVGVHLVDLADPLLAAVDRVDHGRAGLELAGVDPDVDQLAEVGVGGDLVGQAGERLGVARLALDDLLLVVRRVAADGVDVERRRQELHDRVEEGLHALVLERGAAEDRVELVGQGGAADRGLEVLDGVVLVALEVTLHDLVVGLGQGLDELLAPLGGLVGQLRGDLLDLVVLAHLGLAAPGQGTHADQVDDTEEVLLRADRQLQDERGRVEAVDHHVDAAEEVRAGAVELVDEAHPGHGVLVGLAPHGHRLGLDTGDTVEDRDRAVEDAERTLHLGGEVDVARGVDDVDLVVLPPAGRRGRRDRDAALLLLLHPVHRGRALVDLTDLVGDAGVEQDALGGGGLAGVDVRHDADVSDLVEVRGDVDSH